MPTMAAIATLRLGLRVSSASGAVDSKPVYDSTEKTIARKSPWTWSSPGMPLSVKPS